MIWLLHDFFKFYSLFDYENQKICPYSGVSIQLTKNEQLSNACIYVNDPFEPNLNLTHEYAESALTNWKKYCSKAAKITEKFINLTSGLYVNRSRGILDIFDLPVPSLDFFKFYSIFDYNGKDWHYEDGKCHSSLSMTLDLLVLALQIHSTHMTHKIIRIKGSGDDCYLIGLRAPYAGPK